MEKCVGSLHGVIISEVCLSSVGPNFILFVFQSTLFAAILGDLETLKGSIEVRGRMALVPQTPWTFPGTLRENITFGKELEEERYRNVLEACALTEDIKTFPQGDLEVLGDKGISVSGGQKARISLAR